MAYDCSTVLDESFPVSALLAPLHTASQATVDLQYTLVPSGIGVAALELLSGLLLTSETALAVPVWD